MAPPAHEIRFADLQERARSCTLHHGPGGVHKCQPADNCLMRLSPSGMSRQSTSGELDVEGPLHAQREGSPASRSSSMTAASRFQRANGSTGSGLSALGGFERSESGAYRGPFGAAGEDPDHDYAAVMTVHGPLADD
jgi:hypothetical protein